MADDVQEPGTAEKKSETRSGFVALIGPTNAGKSTLLNALVGAKVSIVTHKVQTTRALIRGIAIAGDTQIVFVDTPGIFKAQKRLETAMVSAAWSGAADADVITLVIDARKWDDPAVDQILSRLDDRGRPVFLVLNKIDLIGRDQLLPIVSALNEKREFAETVMVSAMTGDGVGELRQLLADRLAPGPWLYPEDQLTDIPLRQAAAEITREKLMLRLHDELPYSLTVETEDWKDQGKKGVRIEQVIYVARDGHKGIVLGKGGRTIKEIGQAARVDIGEMLERPAHLFLFVKVRENWSENPERYREMGLEFGR